MNNLSPAVCRNALRPPRLSSLSFVAITSAPNSSCARRPFHSTPRRYASEKRHARIYPDSLADTLEDHRTANRRPDGSQPGFLKYYVGDKPAKSDNSTTQTASRSQETDGEGKQSDSQHGRDDQEQKADSTIKLMGKRAGQRQSRLNQKRQKLRLSRRPSFIPDLKRLSWKIDRRDRRKRQCPWLDYMDGPLGKSGSTRLNEEIDAFDKYMSEIPHERIAVEKAQKEIAEILTRAGIPEPVLIGSRRTDMALRHSDLELLIPVEYDTNNGLGNREQIHGQLTNHLSAVFLAFQASDAFCNVHRKQKSLIPIVRAIHTASGLTVTVHSGSRLLSSCDAILSYAQEFPNLRRLFTVVRMALEIRELFGSSRRGPPQYTLTMMIVAALKLDPAAHENNHDVGRQLLHVLRFYKDLDFASKGISMDPPGIFPKTLPPNQIDPCPSDVVRGQMIIGKHSVRTRQNPLCLQDPMDYSNDIGIMCLRTDELKSVFHRLYDDLELGIRAWDEAADSVGNADGAQKIEPQQQEPTLKEQKKSQVKTPKKSPRSPTAWKIENYGLKDDVSLLQYMLGANYESLERLRDEAILKDATKVTRGSYLWRSTADSRD